MGLKTRLENEAVSRFHHRKLRHNCETLLDHIAVLQITKEFVHQKLNDIYVRHTVLHFTKVILLFFKVHAHITLGKLSTVIS